MANKKNMRIAGILQIIIGAATILLTLFLLSKGDASAANLSGTKSLEVLVATYAMAGFQILAGIIGVALAGKKSLLTVIIGVLLFIPTLWNFFNVQGQIVLIIVNALFLAIPYLYMHTAYKTFKGQE